MDIDKPTTPEQQEGEIKEEGETSTITAHKTEIESAPVSVPPKEQTEANPQDAKKEEEPQQKQQEAVVESEPVPVFVRKPQVEITFAKKAQPGTAGKPTNVLVNYYRCAVEDGERHQFDVSFSRKPERMDKNGKPRRLPKDLCRKVFAAEFPHYIFDGNTIGFSMVSVGAETKVHQRRDEDIMITIKPTARTITTGQTSLSEVARDASQMLEILIRQFPSHTMIEVGRNRYFDHNVGMQSSGGVELRSGFFQSIVSTQLGPVMNIDIATCAFWKGTGMVSVMAELMDMRDPSRYRGDAAAHSRLRGLKLVKISVQHGPRKREYPINSMTREGASTLTFDYKGKDITVAQYFLDVYGTKLKYPDLPCAVVGQKGRPAIHLPAELCTILPGQIYKKKLGPQQTSDMIKFAAKKPNDRANVINAGLSKLGYPVNKFLEQFKISMTPKMVSINCRILPPPRVMYGGQQMMQPRDGSWNMRNVRVVQPCTIKSWGVLGMCSPREEGGVIKFMQAMLREGQNLGINLPQNKPPIQYADRGVREDVRKLYETCDQVYGSKPDILIIVYFDNDKGMVYNQIKYLAECKIGFMTQFLNAAKLSKASAPQYAANMWLKINAKLGGVNAAVSPNDIAIASTAPTMIFGLDVSHPSPDDHFSPSICAVTGSLDRNIGRFACVTSYQGHRIEVISGLKYSIIKLIKLFGAKNNVLPARLILFRDGIGEGQFQSVNTVEIAAVKEAVAELYEGNTPPQILFCIVVKRHHARFFPESQQDADRSGNMRAGMVIDTDITSPYMNDFFLQSHAGLQGTNRSMHYYVLYDEIGMTVDALQSFINATCYTFCRCTRSVKIVPSVYYSHLAAERARKWIIGGQMMGAQGFPQMDNVSILSGNSQNMNIDFSWCPQPVGAAATGMYFV